MRDEGAGSSRSGPLGAALAPSSSSGANLIKVLWELLKTVAKLATGLIKVLWELLKTALDTLLKVLPIVLPALVLAGRGDRAGRAGDRQGWAACRSTHSAHGYAPQLAAVARRIRAPSPPHCLWMILRDSGIGCTEDRDPNPIHQETIA